MKKYETIYDEQRRLFRIKALRNFDDIKKGQLGDFIAKESNLSHEGDCWIYGDAEVFGDAQVSENAKIYDQVHVYDFAKVYGEAQIYNYSRISNRAPVYGDAVVAKRGDYLVLHKGWSEHQYITWTRSNGKYLDWPFYGTAEEFIENGNRDSAIFNYAYKQMVEYVNKISEIEL